ncbi:hypothetical protein SARC_04428 [Sphaeroforma arctica JP610]|uniref:J domain-containing protein n=1 Tax=Sphaeroforma arctica JP610 TaxID=667725 RepID=A0A0L0G4Y6_9EUKA|nr:hypothetical protein SARC_04428 [Sphaeroforma arctica JP610]KNC83333.1 hypothetical protein SARC_04428 [Sphaeroforma arctica JP610]|eukprot:XP_014157235.1 hypothetical protein SARC_04428 [Sphaeroforma arctica JP610]
MILAFIPNSECDPPDRACLRIIKCWVCGHAREQVPQRFLDEITCEKCHTLQPPHPEYNYYDLFDKAPTFNVNVKNLQSQYRRSQTLLHPDKWSMSTPEQKRNAAQQSSLLNKAFRTLRDPLQRGLYLLKLRGMPMEEGTDNNDPAFLMEIMDINEAIEDAETEAEISVVHEENKKQIGDVIQQVSEAFKEDDLKRAHTLMGRLQFYENINQLTTHWHPGRRLTITH